MKLTKDEFELLLLTGYSKRIIDLYRKMTNFGFIENPSVDLAFQGECGDIIKFYLRIAENAVIEDAKFQYIGCPALAASGSILAEMVKGNSLEGAKTIMEDDVLKGLGSLPDDECHCATLAVTALHNTIRKYEENKTAS